ncbi:MAG: hypothetical protein ACLQMF_20030 [Rectinemataceae bacterium]
MSLPAPYPDPGADYIAFLRWLGDHVAALEAARNEERITASAMSRELGVTPSYFCNPWRRPNYGPSGTKYTREEWRQWLAIPDKQRRAEWDSMPAAERKQIQEAS